MRTWQDFQRATIFVAIIKMDAEGNCLLECRNRPIGAIFSAILMPGNEPICTFGLIENLDSGKVGIRETKEVAGKCGQRRLRAKKSPGT